MISNHDGLSKCEKALSGYITVRLCCRVGWHFLAVASKLGQSCCHMFAMQDACSRKKSGNSYKNISM